MDVNGFFVLRHLIQRFSQFAKTGTWNPSIYNVMFKSALCMTSFLEVLLNKRYHASNSLISFWIRVYMANVIFSLVEDSLFSQTTYFFWLLSDAFKLLHLIFGNSFTGVLKYKIGVATFVAHSLLECLLVLIACMGLYFPFRHLMILFFLFHILSLKALLTYKIKQFHWFSNKYSKK